jgi:O-antigen/teichoic acid export membrane protein
MARSVWNYSWSILIDNISQKVIFTSDTIVISTILSVPLVTFYAIANQLVEYLRRLIDSSMQVIIPIASEITGARHNNDLKGLLIQSTRFTAWFSLPILVMYIVVGDTFVGLWMGPKYADPVRPILMTLAITQILAVQHYGITVVMRSLEKHKIIAHLRSGEAIVNVILSVILAKQIGLIGVALGTAISHSIVTAIILPRIVTRELNISYLSFIMPAYFKTAIICALIAGLAHWMNVYYTPESLAMFFLNMAVVAFAYIVLSYLVVLNGYERQAISRRILSRLAPSK